jgi:hypothetical protein
MGLWLTQDDEKCLGPATILYGTAALSLSSRPERSVVEGPAVLGTLRGDVFRQSVPGLPHAELATCPGVLHFTSAERSPS